MSLQNIPSRDSSPAPRSVSSAETLYGESCNTRYIRNGMKQLLVTADNKLVGTMAILSPAECFRFRITDRSRESEAEVLKISNPSPTQKIAYKVKTTSPDFYRVHPNTGILEPRETAKIELLLRPDYDGSVHSKAYSDMFLVQIMEIDNEVTSYSEVKDKWKTIDKQSNSYMQNRMWCVLDHGQEDLRAIVTQIDELSQQLTRYLGDDHKELLAQMMEEEIEAANRELVNEMLATSTELEEAKKRQQRRERRQKIVIRFVQLEILMMVLLALILLLIGYNVLKTDHVTDLAHCPGNLSIGCIVPSVAW